LLEVQVSFAILGIGLAGLCPLVVMQLRQVRQLELRLQGQVIETNPINGQAHTMLEPNTYYIVPWKNAWTQKLAGSAQVLQTTTSLCDPGPLNVSLPAPPSFPVTIIELDAAPYSQNLTAYVTVAAP